MATSPSPQDRRAAQREELRKQRQAELKRQRTVRTVVIAAVTAVALVIVAGLGYLGYRAMQPAGPVASPEGVAEGQPYLSFGAPEDSGKPVVELHLDFMCPYCGQAWDAYGETTSELVEDGTITLNLHPISILDRASQGTEYSTRAANAAYCVADEDGEAAYTFIDLLFRNQPAEATAGLDDDELIGYAEQAGAAGAADCITNREYGDYVAERTSETPLAEGQTQVSTPTIVVNDEVIPPTMDPDVDIRANLN